MFNKTISFIKETFKTDQFLPLHAPVFMGNEKKYIAETIDSTFVSSVGEYVNRFEKDISNYTGSNHAIAAVNGTSALHIALLLAGVKKGDLVITQSMTFVATCNAISYCNADPIFVDIDLDTLGMSPKSLEKFLTENCKVINEQCIHTVSGRTISACLPMHTFGHPCRIKEILGICARFSIKLVEDAAESLGSFVGNQHTGTIGITSAISFNGNKVITGGSGGVILTNDEKIALKAKHITTTAKKAHPFEYDHDMIAYNYRLPNLNSALLCAQLEQIDKILSAKRKLAQLYKSFFQQFDDIEFVDERENCRSNFWLNAIKFDDPKKKERFLEETNANGVMTRPVWKLMHKLTMFEDCYKSDLSNSEYLEGLIVNIPSSFIPDL